MQLPFIRGNNRYIIRVSQVDELITAEQGIKNRGAPDRAPRFFIASQPGLKFVRLIGEDEYTLFAV